MDIKRQRGADGKQITGVVSYKGLRKRRLRRDEETGFVKLLYPSDGFGNEASITVEVRDPEKRRKLVQGLRLIAKSPHMEIQEVFSFTPKRGSIRQGGQLGLENLMFAKAIYFEQRGKRGKKKATA